MAEAGVEGMASGLIFQMEGTSTGETTAHDPRGLLERQTSERTGQVPCTCARPHIPTKQSVQDNQVATGLQLPPTS